MSAAALLALAFLVPPQDPDAFNAGLTKVRAQMERRQWDKAYDALRALLTANESAAHAFLEADSIRADMKRIAFWRETREPDPASVVAGRLTSYKDGKIEIAYGYEALMKEMEGAEGNFHWPAPFAGPYTVKVRMRQYPASEPLYAKLNCFNDDWVRVSFGLKLGDGKSFYPASVTQMDGGEVKEKLDENDNIQVAAGAPAEFTLSVTNTKIQLQHAGKKILDAKRPKGPYGVFGMFGFTKNEDMQAMTLEIAGEIEPAWMQNKLDAAVEDLRAAFDAGYKEDAHLPAWILRSDPAPAADAPPAEVQRPHPGPELEGDARSTYRVAVDHMQYLAEEEGPEAQRAYLRELADEGMAPVLVDYLAMRFMEGAGRFEEALDAADKVIAADPKHVDSRIHRARILSWLDRDAEAEEAWSRLVADFPASADAVEEFMWWLMDRNRIPEAGDLARKVSAADAGMAERLRRLRGILLMAEKGPSFERSFEFATEHYVVRSDLSREICSEAARMLESAYTSYSIHLKRVGDLEQNRFRVYLFSGEASYQRYASEAFGSAKPENTAGVYSPRVKQLLIWNLPNPDERRLTVLHEGFHQYIDAVTDDVPIWFNEGLASYYELAETVNGKFTDGQVNSRFLRMLREKGTAPLSEFIRFGREKFRDEHELRNYAQGWALVHFLRHSSEERQAIFDTLFARLCEGWAADAAVHEAFSGADLAALEKDFLDYLDRLAGE